MLADSGPTWERLREGEQELRETDQRLWNQTAKGEGNGYCEHLGQEKAYRLQSLSFWPLGIDEAGGVAYPS